MSRVHCTYGNRVDGDDEGGEEETFDDRQVEVRKSVSRESVEEGTHKRKIDDRALNTQKQKSNKLHMNSWQERLNVRCDQLLLPLVH